MSVVFKGLSIELLGFGYTLNVQDTFLNKITGARVFVTDLGNFQEEGFTDQQGCYFGNADEGVTLIATIVKEGYFNYIHRFRILPVSALTFPTNNFPVLVYDAADSPIDAAQVTIASPSHNDAGTTDANGLFEGTLRADRENTVTVSKSGLTNYSQVINPYLTITCASNNLIAVPVIVLG